MQNRNETLKPIKVKKKKHLKRLGHICDIDLWLIDLIINAQSGVQLGLRELSMI